MKKLKILFLFVVLFLFSNQVFGQSGIRRAECQLKLNELKASSEKIEPKSAEHIKLSNLCGDIELPSNLIEEKKESGWEDVAYYLDEITKIVRDAKDTGVCESDSCQAVKKYKNELEKLGFKFD